ncbi:hypothetical protein [Natrialba asiatica]|uniref:Uncharacterized protein n=1 Tax=Natrialba asiatica (strain ATCC 700177 / DSM 12278 / JCM 9576 / FERM P-10747 / NBRC 102637 / 172P1) TaxID=29540 RepID=M0AV74_NATA1|nr:hypothetical protein [Natrialba asiatica]ELZ02445.1 hypothetical protein C481_07241 [Natrialba asiatica DSM 12278]
MTDASELRDFVNRAADAEKAETGRLPDTVDGGRGGARDIILSYLDIGEIDEARTWATEAAPNYLQYARFVAEDRFDSSDPPSSLTAKPWTDALTAMQLATFAADNDVLLETAEDVYEWASLPFLKECRGWETTLTIDAVAALAALVLGEAHSDYIESAQSKFDSLDDQSAYAKRNLNLVSAVRGTANNDVEQVVDACRGLDDFHETLDIYESIPMELVNIHACFCVVFACHRGLDVTYTSDYVPVSVVSYD